MNNTILLRLLFLIFVIIVAGFFIYENEKSSKHIEKFEDQDGFENILDRVDDNDLQTTSNLTTISSNVHTMDQLYKRRDRGANNHYRSDKSQHRGDSNLLVFNGSNDFIYNASNNMTQDTISKRPLGNNVSTMYNNDQQAHKIDTNSEYKFYDNIIKTYRDTLHRVPNVDELQDAASKISNDADINQLKKQLVDSEEYNEYNANKDTEFSSVTKLGTDGHKQMKIKELYKEIFNKEITFEILDFYMKQLAKHNEDFEQIKKIMEGVFTEQSAFSSTVTDEHNALSYVTNQRNLNSLKYSCDRLSYNKQYTESNLEKKYDDLVLLPGQEWSVPQKHPPVCIAASKCEVRESTDQTALIGTLLNELY